MLLSVIPTVGPGGEPLVVIGSTSGEVWVWTLSGKPWVGARHDGQLGLLGYSRGLSSVIATVGPDGEPLVVLGSESGEVRVLTLSGGLVNVMGDARSVAVLNANPANPAICDRLYGRDDGLPAVDARLPGPPATT